METTDETVRMDVTADPEFPTIEVDYSVQGDDPDPDWDAVERQAAEERQAQLGVDA